jgi:hypothetical protein
LATSDGDFTVHHFTHFRMLPMKMNLSHPSGPWRPWVRTLIALTLLLPCLWGFGTKFRELVILCRGDVNGAFAITPVVNYLCVSSGFLLLLSWAALNGMFRDIELPKYTMLEHEAELDALEDLD